MSQATISQPCRNGTPGSHIQGHNTVVAVGFESDHLS